MQITMYTGRAAGDGRGAVARLQAVARAARLPPRAGRVRRHRARARLRRRPAARAHIHRAFILTLQPNSTKSLSIVAYVLLQCYITIKFHINQFSSFSINVKYLSFLTHFDNFF